MNIRQCIYEDLDTIVRFTLKLHLHEQDNELLPHPKFESNIKRWITTELNNTNSLLLIAQDNQQPTAFIAATSIINDNGFLAEPIKGIIQLLWVEEPFRHLKIAENLLAQVEACFIESGIKYVECNYTASNGLAKSFWDKSGYHQISSTCRKLLKP